MAPRFISGVRPRAAIRRSTTTNATSAGMLATSEIHAQAGQPSVRPSTANAIM
jgi:hypothetical protein